MANDIYLSSGEVCQLAGVPMRTLANWASGGEATPEHSPGGTGNHRAWKLVPEVLGVVVGRSLRRSGYSLGVAAAVVEVLNKYDGATLGRAFAAGKTCVGVIGGRVFPALAERDNLLANSEVPYQGLKEAGLPVAAINIEAAYQLVLKQLAEIRKDKPKRARRLPA